MLETPPLSRRALSTPASPIRRLAHHATAAKAQGKHVYHLNIGQPDIRSPREFSDGIRAFGEEVIAYESSKGNERLCRAWAKYFNRTMGLATRPENYLITTGASEALIFVFMVCCDPGDEVIIFDPTYANYMGFGAISGVTLVPVSSPIERNFAVPSQADIEAKMSARTRAILVCNPNNPTGTVYSREEMQRLINLCNEWNIFLCVDETYREFLYDDVTPYSVLNLEPSNPRIIVVDSLSKRFSLCGARIGCLLTTNERVLATALHIAQARLAVSTIDQFAAAHMLGIIGDDFVGAVRTEYQKRRDTLFDCISRIDGVVAHKPQGAFYSVVSLPVADAEEFAIFLLRDFAYRNATTFVAPASGFYMEPGGGMNQIRLAYVLNSDDIKVAMEILSEGLSAFLNRAT